MPEGEQIERFDFDGYLDADGCWVRYDDHAAALQAERERREEAEAKLAGLKMVRDLEDSGGEVRAAEGSEALSLAEASERREHHRAEKAEAALAQERERLLEISKAALWCKNHTASMDQDMSALTFNRLGMQKLNELFALAEAALDQETPMPDRPDIPEAAMEAMARSRWAASFPDDEWPGPDDPIVQTDMREARIELEAGAPALRQQVLEEVREALLKQAAQEKAIAERCSPGSMGALAERARGRVLEEFAATLNPSEEE